MTAVRLAPWITADPAWRAVFPEVDLDVILREALTSWQGAPDQTARNLLARAWLTSLVGGGKVLLLPPSLEAQSAVLRCSPESAEELIRNFPHELEADTSALEARVMLARLGGASSPVESQLALLDPQFGGLGISRFPESRLNQTPSTTIATTAGSPCRSKWDRSSQPVPAGCGPGWLIRRMQLTLALLEALWPHVVDALSDATAYRVWPSWGHWEEAAPTAPQAPGQSPSDRSCGQLPPGLDVP